MKAKLTKDWEIWNINESIKILPKGTEVSIVPHMEADAGDVLNRPEGMCYLCKLDDGSCTYIPAIYLTITDWDNIDWEQRRYEIAKEALSGMVSIPISLMTTSWTIQEYARRATRLADVLIKELKKHS